MDLGTLSCAAISLVFGSSGFWKVMNGMSTGVQELDTPDQKLIMGDPIAVVGMSCRFPGANNLEEFWDLLISGRNPIGKFPAERPCPLEKRMKWKDAEAGYLKCPVDEFDTQFFGISPREAPFVDPQQRLLLEVIWESLENACINPHELKGSQTGVFVGIWKQDYDKLIPTVGLAENDDHRRYLGNAMSCTASRVSHFLGLYGPNSSIESGCSSSSSAIHFACESLRRGETKLVIASGVNLVLNLANAFGSEDKTSSSIQCKDFKCKTFDERADGFVRSEGCGAVVLKRLSQANQDGDNILGIIRGTALNNDGPGLSFGTPNVDSQERVIRQALADAHVKPLEVGLLEAHGTGTRVGDPTEMEAIGRVYSGKREKPLIISSVKTNIGHTESCAGMAGIIKLLLCFKHKLVPPHLHFQNLNPQISLDGIPAVLPLKPITWNSANRIAAASSFGMSGTNVHIILQEPMPAIQCPERTEIRKMQMAGISAKSEEALEAQRQNLLSFFENNLELPLDGISFSLNTGRANFSHRIGVVATDTQDLFNKLKHGDYTSGKTAVQKSPIAFLFTGQGSQYVGMARELYEVSFTFKSAFDQVDDLFHQQLSIPLREVIWGNKELLNRTIYCQPAIFALQFCFVKLWESFGIFPDVVLGHSVGEFCAAVRAGILSLQDGMQLVVGRSKLVESIECGKMVAVKTSPVEARRLISAFTHLTPENWLDVAAENSPEEVVVAGPVLSIDNFSKFCEREGVRLHNLNSSHAFHSRHMDKVLEEFGQIAAQVSIRTLNCRYVSGTFARDMKKADFNPNYWQTHLRETVKFQDAVKFICEGADAPNIFIEIGTEPILLGLTMANLPNSFIGTFCPTLRKKEGNLSTICNSLSKLYVAGIDISWSTWFGKNSRKLMLPTYPFQRQKYWYTQNEDATSIRPILHPLLGRRVPLPISDFIFTQDLSVDQFPYLEDHKIGDRVIMPGAGFLEILLAAGSHVLQEGSFQVPIQVQSFVIGEALDFTKAKRIQTVVRSLPGDGAKFEIRINTQEGNSDNWTCHARGYFGPSELRGEPNGIDLEQLTKRLCTVDSIQQVYDTVGKVGIELGPSFQSILKAWIGDHELLTEINFVGNGDGYICDPIVMDAMLQTFAFRSAFTNYGDYQLQLPVAIGKFTWLAKPFTARMFTHTVWDEAGEGVVNLYDEEGHVLAIMEGIELCLTSLPKFLKNLDSAHDKTSPEFMEEIWISCPGGTRPYPPQLQHGPSEFTQKTLEEVNRIEKTQLIAFRLADHLFFLYVARAVQECKWSWSAVGEDLDQKYWQTTPLANLNIRPKQFMRIFESFGYMEKSETGNYRILKSLPTIGEIKKEEEKILDFYTSMVGQDDGLLLFVKRCGVHFSNVFSGKMSPLEFMFPEDKRKAGAQRFYEEGPGMKHISDLATSLLLDAIVPTIRNNKSIGPIRILEVGAGSGVCCNIITKTLLELQISFEYRFTDISPTFLKEAQEKFREGVTFSLFDIEQDPLTQGFSPGYFDVIIGSNVVHATKDILESLRNMNLLLRVGGRLFLGEMFSEHFYISFSFGFLDGWWRFADFRQRSPLLNSNEWKECFTKAGFIDSQTLTIFENFGVVSGVRGEEIIANPNNSGRRKVWLSVIEGTPLEDLVARKLVNNGREVKEVSTGNSAIPQDLEGIIFYWTANNGKMQLDQVRCQQLLTLCQNLIVAYHEVRQKPALVLVTRGVQYIGDDGVGNPNGATAHSFLRVLSNENPEYPVVTIDTDQSESNLEMEAEEIFAQLWSSRNKEISRAIRDGKVYAKRLVPARLNNTRVPLQLPNSTRFKIHSPPSKSLYDLKISAAPMLGVAEDEVEVCIRAAALNFHDIVLILQPELFQAPGASQQDPGLDIAGIVSRVGPNCTKFKIGDQVYGYVDGGGLASHLVVSERRLIKKPDMMTFSSTATIPVAFLTVFYTFDFTGISEKDRVLIHVASGGVGLAAIQVAKNAGAQIFATAGSRRKREYLRFIGIQHVYHSRNTDFAGEILRDTNGAGVTVVLNSLTGPGFKEASLRACAPMARFAEIGKRNIWSVEEVQKMRPDVAYFIVDLEIIAFENPEVFRGYNKRLESEIQNIYKGLPHETFPLDLIREAFHYFQDAKHIGKVVITTPESKMSPDRQLNFYQPLFNHESTYMITGGLGGIGLEVAKWMIDKGAGHLILVGRNPPNSKAQSVIEDLNRNKYRATVALADVGSFQECESVLTRIVHLNLPPLRGIMHAAGELSDSIILNQTWESFEKVFRSKVQGTWNLHQLTLGQDLEFLILFSSIASQLGTTGQANHAAANSFMDSFANYRHAIGLPAMTINFGVWGEVGQAARTDSDEIHGLKPFSPHQGIAIIEKALQNKKVQTIAAHIPAWSKVKKGIRLGHYLDEMTSTTAESATVIQAEQLFDELKEGNPAELLPKVEAYVEKLLKETLHMPTSESIGRDQNFTEIGIDSLMAMELRNRLQTRMGEKQLALSTFQHYRTIHSLSAHIVSLVTSGVILPQNIEEIVAQDSILPPDIQASSVPPCKPSDFRHIFLTGATGYLGVYMIQQILAERPNAIIHCLVRAVDTRSATDRLRTALESFKLCDKINAEQLVALAGNLTMENFGLKTNDFVKLARETDAIIHCAAKASHIEGYATGGQTSIRFQNVLTMQRILKFGGSFKTKPILFASSLIAATKVNEDGTITEEFPNLEEKETELEKGYQLSKFICEKLVAQGMERGIPAIVFRYPALFGAAGQMSPRKDHIWSIILSCIRTQMFPDALENRIPVIPVDVAAHISVRIFFQNSSELGLYNLTSDSFNFEDIKECFSKFGLVVNSVPFQDWREHVFKDFGANELGEFTSLYEDSTRASHPVFGDHSVFSSSTLQLRTLSEKVKRNYPEANSKTVSARTLLEQQLLHHFRNTKTKNCFCKDSP